MSDDIEFWTTLIKVESPSHYALDVLKANCTHVAGDYWIMEGDLDYLRDEGVRFSVVAEGAVGSLGDLTEKELRQVCFANYGVRIS